MSNKEATIHPILSMSHPIVSDVCTIIERGRRKAYQAVGQVGIMTFWEVGKRIVEEEQQGETRATYGTKLIQNLSDLLTPIYGTSYNKRNLYYYRKLYLLYPDPEIVNTRVHNLWVSCTSNLICNHIVRTKQNSIHRFNVHTSHLYRITYR